MRPAPPPRPPESWAFAGTLAATDAGPASSAPCYPAGHQAGRLELQRFSPKGGGVPQQPRVRNGALNSLGPGMAHFVSTYYALAPC